MLILTGPLVSLLMLTISVLCIVMTKLKLKQCKYNDVEVYHYQMSLYIYMEPKKIQENVFSFTSYSWSYCVASAQERTHF